MWHQMWADMFVLGVPVLEKVLRATIVYVFLVVGLRIGGKRELAQLNPLDLVVLLTLSNAVQNAIIGNDNSVIGGIVGATALLAVNHASVRARFHRPKLERLIEGEAAPLIAGGQVQSKRLAHEFISMADLESAARMFGFASLDDVNQAILEPSGHISFLGKNRRLDEHHQRELLHRLDAMNRELSALRADLGAKPA
jgi:uncharacterized membrane protein YcaP (DUF421 family)